jgi:hypothetical protein
MVSIAAFQAVDPGSIPGRRMFFSFSCHFCHICQNGGKKLLACRDHDSNLGYFGNNAGS